MRFGDAWHPLRFRLGWLREALDRLRAAADQQQRPVPALVPRIVLRITDAPVTGSQRLAGEGTIGQVLDDLEQLRLLGAGTVVLDPFNGDPAQTHHPQEAWQMLATVSACWARHTPASTRLERTMTFNEELLRQAIDLAGQARAAGNPPFGSLLAGPDGTVLAKTATRRSLTGTSPLTPS